MWAGLAIGLLAGGVAVEVPEGELGSRVVLRLVDDGYDVLPGSVPAPQQLSVGGSGTSLWVRADGASTVRYDIRAPSHAVAELEVLQRATLALEAAGATAQTSTVSLLFLEMVGPVSLAVRGQIALGVLEAGFGLTGTATRARARLCVAAPPDGLTLGLGDPGGDCKPEAAGPVARTIRALFTRAEAPSVPKSETTVVGPGFSWRLRAAGGAEARSAALDPFVTFGVDLAGGWLGARLDALLEPASGGPIHALEIQLVAGPSIRIPLGESWMVQLSGRAGIHMHRYAYAGSESGQKLDFTLDFPIGLSWRFLYPLAVELEVVPGLDARSRRHTQGETILWSRGAARLSGSLGLAYEGTF